MPSRSDTSPRESLVHGRDESGGTTAPVHRQLSVNIALEVSLYELYLGFLPIGIHVAVSSRIAPLFVDFLRQVPQLLIAIVQHARPRPLPAVNVRVGDGPLGLDERDGVVKGLSAVEGEVAHRNQGCAVDARRTVHIDLVAGGNQLRENTHTFWEHQRLVIVVEVAH
eukprot:scaffold655_cov379-Prasinococcus_capsulatus_cf.AAC.20